MTQLAVYNSVQMVIAQHNMYARAFRLKLTQQKLFSHNGRKPAE